MLGLVIALLATLTSVQILSQQNILERELAHREKLMREKTLQRGQMLSNNLANQVAIEMAAYNLSKVTELIYTAVKDDPELAYGLLMDCERVVYVHTQQQALEYETLSAPADFFAVAQKQPAQQTLSKDHEEIAEFISPIQMSTQVWGVLRLGFSMELVSKEMVQSRQEINEQIRIMVIKSVITAIIFLFFGFIMVVMISTKITTPLMKLTNAARELAKGNFSTRHLVYSKYQDEINVLSSTFDEMITNLKRSYRQLEQHNKAYERFVPREFLKLLNKKNLINVQLGDHVQQEMTILFSDIRDFTAFSEKMTPEDNFKFINAYLGQMEVIISQHHGFIDKYIGDGIMALFPNADEAVTAAIAMSKQLALYNQTRGRPGRPIIKIGIGINTGSLMLGTIGSQNRMDSTVISDAVNLASRIEGLTKIYGATLLISEPTYHKLADPSQYQVRVIDATKVKGKAADVTVYEVFDTEQPESITLKNQTLSTFKEGFVLYHCEQFNDARPFFEQVLQVNPNDRTAQIYLERCDKILSMTMPEKSKILVVDDIPINIKLLSNLLMSNHFEVVIATDGRFALEVVNLKAPDLILLDIMMPDMSGFEVCKQLKANPKTQDIPIIFISGLSETADKVNGFNLGAVDYITKPFQQAEVLARVKTHLYLSHLQQQASWCLKKVNQKEAT